MSNLTSQSNILNISPKAEFAPSASADSAYFSSESADAQGFLSALTQALDETSEFAPQNLASNATSNNGSLNNATLNNATNLDNETLQNAQEMSFESPIISTYGELSPNELFDNLNFMQILTLLDEMQVQTSDIKLSSLSNRMQNLLQTQGNLDILKGAKSVDELLQLAKSLNLNVKSVNIEQIREFKGNFPNLNSAGFFDKNTQSLDGVLKEYLNTKISSLIKESEAKFSEANSSHKNIKKDTNFLAKALQSLDNEGNFIKNELKFSVQKSDFADGEGLSLKNAKSVLNAEPKAQGAIFEKSQNLFKSNETPNLKTSENLAKTSPNPVNLTQNLAKIDEKNLNKDFKTALANADELEIVAKNANLNLKENLKESIKTKANLNEPKSPTNSDLKGILNALNSAQNAKLDKINESAKTAIEPKINSQIQIKENKENKANLASKELKETAKNELDLTKFNEKQAAKNEKSTQKFTLNLNENEQPKLAAKASEQLSQTPLKEKIKTQDFKQDKFVAQDSVKMDTQSEFAPKENAAFQNSGENKITLESLLNRLQSKPESNSQNSTLSAESEKQINADKFSLEFGADNDNSELNSALKDLSQVAKSELKNELSVKETFRHFAQDFKEQMQAYKPPITRFNITLNPSNLGEVEVTLVQRGQNLQVNFNSSTSTMNLFIQNQAEFKNSLVNMGFTGLEMNFSDQSKKDRQQQNKAKNSYAYEENYENLSPQNTTLDFVLARYF